MPSSAQGLAAVGRAPVLPHDRVVNWPARDLVPKQDCFALIGNANGRDVVADLADDLATDREGSIPDQFWIVLDPAGLGVDLI